MPQKHPLQELLNRMSENWPETTSPETDVVLGIIRFNDLIRARTDKALSAFNLSRAAFEVLAALRSLPEPRQLTPTELSDSILISTGGMTKVLINLEGNGMIERISNDEDKRSKLVKLTPAGKCMAEQSMKEVARQDRELFAGFVTAAEVEKLRRNILGSLNKIELGE
jgi:DNA-binding MarR family transcriptional regulator